MELVTYNGIHNLAEKYFEVIESRFGLHNSSLAKFGNQSMRTTTKLKKHERRKLQSCSKSFIQEYPTRNHYDVSLAWHISTQHGG